MTTRSDLHLSRAYYEGQEAYREGRSFASCPATSERARQDWLRGWKDTYGLYLSKRCVELFPRKALKG